MEAQEHDGEERAVRKLLGRKGELGTREKKATQKQGTRRRTRPGVCQLKEWVCKFELFFFPDVMTWMSSVHHDSGVRVHGRRGGDSEGSPGDLFPRA